MDMSRELRNKLQTIKDEQAQSLMIQDSSQKLLSFIVHDMLDFAQINQGNFRKNVHEFNLKDAIDELTNIQMLKAEVSGVELIVKMKEFPRNNYLVQSDQQRIQQVVLNLLSNGIKFTKNGGYVSIECKYIDHIEDLHHKDHVPFFQKSQGHGMLQIKVKDSGIGIRKEEHDKLFKLFGFLDATNEINAKGVGLGLNISQRIQQQFGGQILLESEIDQGSTFTCLFDLERKTGDQNKVCRHLNPERKRY